MKTRNYGIDLFKLIAAILVVSIHTSFLSDVSKPLFNIYEYITSFAVPFFFIAAGYYVAVNTKEDCCVLQNKAKKQIFRLLPPFLFWGTVYALLSTICDVVVQGTPIKTALIKRVAHIIFDGPGGALWYIYTTLWVLMIITIFAKTDICLKFISAFFAVTYFGEQYGDFRF